MKTVILWRKAFKLLALLLAVGFAWGGAWLLFDIPKFAAIAGGVVIGATAARYGMMYFGEPFRIDFD